MEFSQQLFFVLAAALVGGLSVRVFKLQPLTGYTLAGIVFAAFLPKTPEVWRLAEIGTILLLFSIGVELSWARLSRVFRVAVVGGLAQILAVTALGYWVLSFLGVSPVASLILSAGFSLSSTALVVKILADRGETDTIHGGVMIGWLLVQDLAVVPMMVVLIALGKATGGFLFASLNALLTSGVVILATVILGRYIAPFLIHRVASVNNRELLLLSAMALALGTAAAMSAFGISPALGAFLAGVVIAESQENHAVLAEIRPLRDLFVALFFVTLGLLITPGIIFANFGIILGLALFILIIKFAIVLTLSLVFGYHGRTAVATGIGLAQVGEFSFIIFSQAQNLRLLSSEATSIGIAVALLTIIVTPLLFRSTIPFWKRLRDLSVKWPFLNKAFLGWDRKTFLTAKAVYQNHVIICGYGRVGSWVGKALREVNLPFTVVDYNQRVVNSLKEAGESVIYGDPSEPEVLEAAGIREAKAIVIAVPDRVVQEALVTHVQTVAPQVKIITRVHLDEDWEKLKTLRVDKIVQPEFEAALAIIRAILSSSGKSQEEIGRLVKSLRLSHSAKL